MRRYVRFRDYACLLALLGTLTSACGDDDETGDDDLERDASSANAGDGGSPSSDAGRDIDAATGAGDAGDAGDAGLPALPKRVAIADGELEGQAIGATAKFLGIPYAKPPVGPLRWQAPKKNDKWTGVRPATQYGKRCAQLASTTLMNAASQDEDCLYLNVWAPSEKPATALPVMVWIHGGGNVNGSASEPVPYSTGTDFYDGTPLQRKGVVVVTLNYRLGVLGFLAADGLAAEGEPQGNQGLLDQVAALEWVRDNIGAFGGDPKNVTIFGESAGSFDVCAHVASAKSRPLFQKAISQSGGCTTKQTTKEQAATRARDYATRLGCTGDAAATLACLRTKPVPELLAAFTGTYSPNTFNPIVDGVFWTDQPRTLFDAGNIAKVPYLIGSNTDEGTLFTPPGVTTQEQYIAALERTFPGRGAAVAAVYPASNFATAKPNPYHAALARAIGDSRLVCTTTDSAVRHAKAGNPVYLYNYDIATPVGDLGATHGAELTLVFGTSKMFSPPFKDSSERIQRYWTNFAKTGNPNGAPDLAWPAFAESTDQRLNIAFTPTVVSNFRAQECAFWRAGYDATFAAP